MAPSERLEMQARAAAATATACRKTGMLLLEAISSHLDGCTPHYRRFKAAQCEAAERWMNYAVSQNEKAAEPGSDVTERHNGIMRALDGIDWIAGVEPNSFTMNALKFGACVESWNTEIVEGSGASARGPRALEGEI